MALINAPSLISEASPSVGVPRVVLPFYFASAVPAKSWVSVDLTVSTSICPLGGAATIAPATEDYGSVLGVIETAAVAGHIHPVVCYGFVSKALSNASPNAQGEMLVTSGVAGQSKVGDAGDMHKIGVVMSADDGTGCDTFVTCL